MRRNLFSNMRKRLILIYTFLIVVIGIVFLLGSVLAYRQTYYRNSIDYIGDLTGQVTKNLQMSIHAGESLTFALLSNTTVQQKLTAVNRSGAGTATILDAKSSLWKELVSLSPPNGGFISLSIFSDSEMEYTVQKVTGKAVEFGFTKEEIYEGNGALLWALTEPGGYVSACRAILSMETMMPIGYINVVYDSEGFADVVEQLSTTYSAGTYVMDGQGRVVISNTGHTGPWPYEPVDWGQAHMRSITHEGQEVLVFQGEKMSNGWRLLSLVPVEQFNHNVRQFILMISLVMACTILLATVINAFVTRRLSKPTQDILQSMERFGDGDLSSRSPVLALDDVGRIGQEFNRLADKIEMLIEKVYKMEISNKQAEINMLKMQVNPHFLYNTLDTISWMAVLKGNEEISDITVALAQFLRATINGRDFITLEEELSIVKNYLFIQNFRFSDKIRIEYAIDPDSLRCVVPSFILQPLAENAIIHGMEPRQAPGLLRLSAARAGGDLVLRTQDNGAGMDAAALAQLKRGLQENRAIEDSIGLHNVYRRLVLHYGERMRFTIQSAPNAGTCVEIIFPAEENRAQQKEDCT